MRNQFLLLTCLLLLINAVGSSCSDSKPTDNEKQPKAADTTLSSGAPLQVSVYITPDPVRFWRRLHLTVAIQNRTKDPMLLHEVTVSSQSGSNILQADPIRIKGEQKQYNRFQGNSTLFVDRRLFQKHSEIGRGQYPSFWKWTGKNEIRTMPVLASGHFFHTTRTIRVTDQRHPPYSINVSFVQIKPGDKLFHFSKYLTKTKEGSDVESERREMVADHTRKIVYSEIEVDEGTTFSDQWNEPIRITGQPLKEPLKEPLTFYPIGVTKRQIKNWQTNNRLQKNNKFISFSVKGPPLTVRDAVRKAGLDSVPNQYTYYPPLSAWVLDNGARSRVITEEDTNEYPGINLIPLFRRLVERRQTRVRLCDDQKNALQNVVTALEETEFQTSDVRKMTGKSPCSGKFSFEIQVRRDNPLSLLDELKRLEVLEAMDFSRF